MMLMEVRVVLLVVKRLMGPQTHDDHQLHQSAHTHER